MRRNSGFSIVELVVIVVISGVLAAIAVPINTNSLTKAKLSEADAALRSIQTHLRIYYNRTGEYPRMAEGSYVIGADWHNLESGQLTGEYFTDYSYTIASSPTQYTITCVTGTELPHDIKLDAKGELIYDS